MAFFEAHRKAISKRINYLLRDEADLKAILPLNTENDDLCEACSQGFLLCKLIHTIDPTCINLKNVYPRPSGEKQAHQNLEIAINSSQKLGCNVVGLTPATLSGQESALIVWLWQIIKYDILRHINFAEFPEMICLKQEEQLGSLPPEAILLTWVNKHLQNFKPDISVRKFAEMKNEDNYFILFNQLDYIKCPLIEAEEKDKEKRFKRLIQLAENFGCKIFLDAEDLATRTEEFHLVFVGQIFQAKPAWERIANLSLFNNFSRRPTVTDSSNGHMKSTPGLKSNLPAMTDDVKIDKKTESSQGNTNQKRGILVRNDTTWAGAAPTSPTGPSTRSPLLRKETNPIPLSNSANAAFKRGAVPAFSRQQVSHTSRTGGSTSPALSPKKAAENSNASPIVSSAIKPSSPLPLYAPDDEDDKLLEFMQKELEFERRAVEAEIEQYRKHLQLIQQAKKEEENRLQVHFSSSGDEISRTLAKEERIVSIRLKHAENERDNLKRGTHKSAKLVRSVMPQKETVNTVDPSSSVTNFEFKTGFRKVFVLVSEARNLIACDTLKKTSNPFIVIKHLTPDGTLKAKHRSKVIKHNITNPVFDTTMEYRDFASDDILQLLVLNDGKTGFDFMGELVLTRDEMLHAVAKWYSLQQHANTIGEKGGETFFETQNSITKLRSAIKNMIRGKIVDITGEVKLEFETLG